MTYIIPAILTFIVGLILWLIKKERLSLSYEIVESESFPREKGLGRYFVINLYNSGNKEIKDTNLKIHFQIGEIESHKVSNDSLLNNQVIKTNSFECSLPLLNPKEKFSITITTIGNNNLTSPTVSARAAGVTAAPKQNDLIQTYTQHILTITAVLVSITTGVIIYNTYNHLKLTKSLDVDQLLKNTEKIEEKSKTLDSALERMKTNMAKKVKEELEIKQGKPEREQLIFVALNKANLSDLIPGLMSSGEGVPFWRAGLYVMHSFLVDQKRGDSYLLAMESLAETDSIAPASRGFILYLAGKICQEMGKSEKAIVLFQKCKTETPLMYDFLMEQDPAYNLSAVRDFLKKPNKSQSVNP